MKIAYLILAHDHPRHLQRLVDALSSPDNLVYVHLDAKTDIAPFLGIFNERVMLCPTRIDCAWGNISLVDATLALARMALAGGRCDYYALLSGACYPIQPNEYIAELLDRAAGAEFIETYPFPDARYGKPIERLTRYYIRRNRPFVRLKWELQQLINVLLPARDYRSHFGGMELVCGSQWWTLTPAALRHVVDYIDRHPKLYAFCRHIDCPDEFLFQLILWNSPFRSRIAHSLTFTHWLPGETGPVAIDATYLARFRAPFVVDSDDNLAPTPKREVVYARKFTDRSASVVDALDEVLAEKRERDREGVPVRTVAR